MYNDVRIVVVYRIIINSATVKLYILTHARIMCIRRTIININIMYIVVYMVYRTVLHLI